MLPNAARQARVRVCASTSNLGPGFDVLGAALDLPLSVRAFRRDGGAGNHAIRSTQGEALAWPAHDNLLLRAFDLAQGRLGGRGAADFDVASEIPVGRGLGSSAAAIVAGLLLGSALSPRPASRERLHAWALELEGHPDNVTPALFGGCVLTCPRSPHAPGNPDGQRESPRVVRVALSPRWSFAVAWPERRVETAFARALLPAQVGRDVAVENARNLALVIEGLRSGDGELLAAGNVERLHVPYRLPNIPGGEQSLAAARAAGAALATISGSGSALVSVCARERAAAVAAAMGQALLAAGQQAAWRALECAAPPPVVELGGDGSPEASVRARP